MKTTFVPISSFGNVITGKTPKTSNENYYFGNIPFITPTDIPDFSTKHIFKTDSYISQEGLNSQKNTLLPENSICVSCIATIGKVIQTVVPSITNQQINSIIPNKNFDSDYLFYLFRYYLEYLEQIGGGTGSGTPIISKEKFKRLKYPVFLDVNYQRKIADILSTYDKLIENNNKRISILEQEAEELYKEWFVRFRFPGYEESAFKNTSTGLRIPESFVIKPISSVLSYYIGGGWGNDDFTNEYPIPASVIRGADFPNIINGCYTKLPYRYHKKSNHKSRILNDGDIVFEISGGTAEQPVGRSIYVTKGLTEANHNVICASFCKLLRCNNTISSEYFYYWLKFLYETRIIDRYQLQSTGIINFNFDFFLRKGFVMIPSREIMTKFSKQITRIFDLIDALGKENYLLSTQRDYLLPRLMSGKLEVK